MAQEQGVDIADVAESGTRVKVAVMVGTVTSNKKKKKTQKWVSRFKNNADKIGDTDTKIELINKQAEEVVVNGIYHPGTILTLVGFVKHTMEIYWEDVHGDPGKAEPLIGSCPVH